MFSVNSNNVIFAIRREILMETNVCAAPKCNYSVTKQQPDNVIFFILFYIWADASRVNNTATFSIAFCVLCYAISCGLIVYVMCCINITIKWFNIPLKFSEKKHNVVFASFLIFKHILAQIKSTFLHSTGDKVINT